MRFRVLLPTVLLASAFVVPHAVYAAIPFFGPIIPDAVNKCPASWGLLIQVINNVISLLITLAIVFVAPIMIAYSGFLFVINPVDPNGISKAKGILLNTIVGIIIALSGYLIVSAIMAVLYHPSDSSWTTQWSQIVSGKSTDLCLIQAGALNNLNQTGYGVTGVSSNGGVSYSGNLAQCASSNSACSPTALQAVGFTQTQANVMSCIAVTESSGQPSTPPYNTTHPGSNSTACGTFQITQTTWNGSASGSCSDFSANCQNQTCNMQVAQKLVATVGYTPWTCANCNSKASSCVQQYGGG